jgi:glycosyltransferase involved in cell wall biosynthesis
MANVWLGTPTTRDFPAQYVRSLMQTRLDGLLGFDAVVGQAIDVGRNAVVQHFLQRAEFDYLLMHDSDATWHPEAVQRLAARNLPVVSAIIFKRGLPTVPTIGKQVGVSPQGTTMYSFADTVNRILEKVEQSRLPQDFSNELLFEEQPDDLVEVDGAGAHFMLLRRDVLEKIGYPWFACTSTNGGEDFDFCRRVKRAGFKLYADFSIFTGHVVGAGMEIGLKEFLLFRDKTKVETLWSV